MGDSFVVDKTLMVRDSPVKKPTRLLPSRVLFLAASWFFVGAITSNYFHKKSHENSNDLKPKIEQYQSKESDKNDAKPVVKYKN